jgi:hypothetical protein
LRQHACSGGHCSRAPSPAACGCERWRRVTAAGTRAAVDPEDVERPARGPNCRSGRGEGEGALQAQAALSDIQTPQPQLPNTHIASGGLRPALGGLQDGHADRRRARVTDRVAAQDE